MGTGLVSVNWPWVSRRAYDMAIDERDRLRAQCDRLLDHITRLKRVQHDLPELLTQPREERKKGQPPPPEFMVYIDAIDDQELAAAELRAGIHRNQQGEPWSDIVSGIQHLIPRRPQEEPLVATTRS